MAREVGVFGLGDESTSNYAGVRIPDRGDRIERTRLGVTTRGTVQYADQLQILVKWDDGRSSSLRVGRDQFTLGAQPPSEDGEAAPHTERVKQEHDAELAA
jgi:hypothetical protein